MIRTSLIVLAMTLGLSAASYGQTADKYQEFSAMYVTKAGEAIAAGDAKDAQALYEKALVANPANVQALVEDIRLPVTR